MWICQRAGSLFSGAITKNLIIYIPIRLKNKQKPPFNEFLL